MSLNTKKWLEGFFWFVLPLLLDWLYTLLSENKPIDLRLILLFMIVSLSSYLRSHPLSREIEKAMKEDNPELLKEIKNS